MSATDAVTAARAVFPALTVSTPAGAHPLIAVMVAIAGAESGWDPRCAGDPGLPGPHCDGLAHGRPVPAATSWGLWQIHNVHGDYLRGQTAAADACDWAEWLYDPLHNALAALHVLGADPAGGLRNWSTWGGRLAPWPAGRGPYRSFLASALTACRL